MGARGDAEAHRSAKGQCPHRSLALPAGGAHLHPQGALAVLHGGHQSRLCHQDRATCGCRGP